MQEHDEQLPDTTGSSSDDEKPSESTPLSEGVIKAQRIEPWPPPPPSPPPPSPSENDTAQSQSEDTTGAEE